MAQPSTVERPFTWFYACTRSVQIVAGGATSPNTTPCPSGRCWRGPTARPRRNRLALSWTDSVLARLILGSLLQDKRGSRQGFPPDVAAELHRLRQELVGAANH